MIHSNLSLFLYQIRWYKINVKTATEPCWFQSTILASFHRKVLPTHTTDSPSSSNFQLLCHDTLVSCGGASCIVGPLGDVSLWLTAWCALAFLVPSQCARMWKRLEISDLSHLHWLAAALQCFRKGPFPDLPGDARNWIITHTLLLSNSFIPFPLV